jgi:hypothetical protein
LIQRTVAVTVDRDAGSPHGTTCIDVAATIAITTIAVVAVTAGNGATAEQAGRQPAITVNTVPELPDDEPPPDDAPEPTDPAPINPPTTAAPDTSVTTTAVPVWTVDQPPDVGPTTTASPTGDITQFEKEARDASMRLVMRLTRAASPTPSSRSARRSATSATPSASR